MEFRFNKLFLLTVGLTIVSLTSWAQTFPLQIQVSVMPPYSAYLQDYPGTGQQVRVFIINTSRTTYQIRLTGQLTGDNGIEIRTSPNYRPPRPVTVPPGQTLLTRNDLEGLFDLNQIDVTGIDKNLLARGFPLPDGTYQLCIRAYNETATNTAAVAFGQPLSAEFPIGCSAPIVIKSVEPPILISPLCDAEVTATNPQAVVFTWTPPAGVSPASVEYILRVVELPQVDVDPNVFIDAVVLPKSGVEVRGLRTSTFLYGPTQPPLIVGKRYAWRVQAIDRSRKLNFLNDGKAPVCAFTYGTGLPIVAKKPGLELVQKPMMVLPLSDTSGQDTPPAGATAIASKIPASSTPYEQKITNCSCKTPPGNTSGTVDDNKAILTKKQLIIAGFTVDLTDIKLDENQMLTGKGTVQIPYVGSGYIKVRVTINKVQCNSSGQAIAGNVRGLLNENAKLLPGYDKPDFSALDLSPSDISGIGKKLDDIKKDVTQSVVDSKNSVGWEMPLGMYTAHVDVAITNIVFEPAQAYFDAVTWFKVASSQFGGIPLSATKVCLSPDKPVCGDMTLYLGLDTPFSKILTFKGATTDAKNKSTNNLDFKKITNVNLNNWEFKSFHIVADLKLPGLKEANGANKDKDVAFTLVYDSPKADLNDWTATVQFPDFYVDKLSRDFIFSMDGKPGIYDQSENPDEYTDKLPNDYPQPGQKPGAEWTGLFFPKLKVTTTVLKSLNQGKETTVSVENLIYDNNGFTGLFTATPVISLGDGSLDGWYCSADTLRLNLFTSQFKDARLTGRVVMPIFKYTDENKMQKSSIWPYTCTLSKDDKPNSGLTYQFKITSPKEDANVELWAAKLSVLDGTNITVGNKDNKDGAFNASVTLNAKLSIDAKIVSPGMTVEGMKLQSSPPDGESYFTPGKLNSSFASPQKSLLAAADDEGFPVTIKSVSLTNVQGQKSKFDFKFTGDLTLMEGNINASVSPYVRFNIGFGANKRPNWSFEKVGVDSVGIHGSLSFMRIDGSADFFDSDAKYGNGFKGDMSIKLIGAAGLTVTGYFGRVNGFRYWQVGGLADLPAPIPIPGTPLSMMAFGGGAFHNMEKVTQLDANGKPTKVDFKPSQKHDGFEVAVEVAVQTRDLLDMIGTMAATISTENGFHLSDLRLDLNATLLGPEKEKALARGNGYIDVNFDGGYFDSHFHFDLHYQPGGGPFSVDGSGDMGMYVQAANALGDQTQVSKKAKEGAWYFYLGLPDATPCGNADDCFKNSQRIKLAISVKELGSLAFGSYFVMYHDLKPDGVERLPPPPWGISEADLKALGYKGGQPAGKDALGFGSGFVTDDKFEFGPFEAKFHAAFGYDFALQKVTAPCNVGGPLPGINGWYANGQLYADLALTLGINIDIWIYSGYLELLKVQATALLEGGMVNPIWIHGSILLRYRALGGRIKGSTTFEMWYNKDEQCKPAFEQPNPFADLPIIAGMTPENNSKSVSVISPYYAEFSYPVRTLIQINDVDPETKQPVSTFRTFRLDFTSGTSANPFVTTQIQASSTNPSCTLSNSGRLRFGSDPDGGGNFNVSFFRDATLPPNAKLSVSLTVGVNLLNTTTNQYLPYEYPKGSGKLVTETKSYTFTTGDCVGSLSQDGAVPSVAYSYPFEGQRYLTVGDAGIFGYVELATAFGCCLDKIQSDKYYQLSVRYTALKGGKFDKTDASTVWKNAGVKFDGSLVEFGIPLNFLQKKTLYRLEIFREPTDALVAEQKKIIAQQKGKIRKDLENNYLGGQKAEFGFGDNITASSKPGKPGAGVLGDKIASINGLAQSYNAAYIDQTVQQENGKLGNAVGAQVTGQATGTMADIKLGKGKSDEEVDVKTQLEQPVYTYYFQTSQYSTLAEKLKASKFLAGEQKSLRTPTIETYTLPIQAAEGFDSYELLWKSLPNGKVLPPLVLQQVLDTTNPWFADYVKPMVDLINTVSTYQQGDGNILFKTVANTNAEQVNYDQLLRQVVSFAPGSFDTPQPPISKNNLKAFLKN